MYCIHCGVACQPADSFCGACGGSVPVELRTRPIEPHGVPERRSQGLSSRAMLWGAASLAVVAVVVGVVYVSNRDEPTAAPPSVLASRFDYRTVAPSVLTLYCFNQAGKLIAQASGFIIRSDGVAVTNWHVANDAYSITATNGRGESFTVIRLLSTDAENDLVTMQLGPAAGDSPVKFIALSPGDTRTLNPGQKVFTVSAPEGLSQTVGDGLLSAVRSEGGLQLFQITAPISPGSSGGPVFDERGQVIAVIKSQLPSGQQLNFAIPIDIVVRLLNEPSRALANPRAPETPPPLRAPSRTRVEPSSSDLFDQGMAAHKERRYSEAARLFERVIAKDATEAAAYFNAGLAYSEMEDFGHASDYFSRFIALAEPNDEDIPRARRFLAAYASSLGQQAAPPPAPAPAPPLAFVPVPAPAPAPLYQPNAPASQPPPLSSGTAQLSVTVVRTGSFWEVTNSSGLEWRVCSLSFGASRAIFGSLGQRGRAIVQVEEFSPRLVGTPSVAEVACLGARVTVTVR